MLTRDGSSECEIRLTCGKHISEVQEWLYACYRTCLYRTKFSCKTLENCFQYFTTKKRLKLSRKKRWRNCTAVCLLPEIMTWKCSKCLSRCLWTPSWPPLWYAVEVDPSLWLHHSSILLLNRPLQSKEDLLSTDLFSALWQAKGEAHLLHREEEINEKNKTGGHHYTQINTFPLLWLPRPLAKSRECLNCFIT